MYICDEHGLHGKGDECPKCLGVDKMNNNLREQVVYKLIKIHKLGRVGADFDDKEANELITLIRTPTLDEAIEAVDPYDTNGSAMRAIDNLKGKSDE